MKKRSILLSALCAVGFGTVAFADDAAMTTPAADSSSALNNQVASLQQQVDALSKQVAGAHPSSSQSSAAGDDMSAGPSGQYWPNVSIAPYIGVPTLYNGFELIVNQTYVNDDVKLLQLRQAERAAYKQNGGSDPEKPHLVFSGMLEAQASYADNYDGTSVSDVDLTDAELDSYIEMSPWISGYMTFMYDNSVNTSASPNRTDNSNLNLNQGFIMLGDFDKSPMYMSVGQEYMPFGQYSSFMVSDPYTKTLARVKTRGATFGYVGQQSDFAPYFAAFAYQSATDVSNSDERIDDGGANLGFKFNKSKVNGDFGVSWLSQMADSQGLQGDGDQLGFGESGTNSVTSTGFENMDHRVPAVDVHTSMSTGPVTLIGEYVQATTSFSSDNMEFNDEGAQPKAMQLEMGYSFDAGDLPSTVAVGYNKSWEALAIDLPEDAYLASYSVSIWSHTLLSFEVAYNNGYSDGSTATLQQNDATNSDQLGEHYLSTTLQFDTYF